MAATVTDTAGPVGPSVVRVLPTGRAHRPQRAVTQPATGQSTSSDNNKSTHIIIVMPLKSYTSFALFHYFCIL